MLYQDLNGNYGYGDSIAGPGSRFQRTLPAIYEDRCLHSVPDINLECDEIINWDEIETCIYNSSRNEKLSLFAEEIRDTEVEEDSSEFYHDYPPPNSPVKGIEIVQPALFLQNHYVNSLLQIWRDSHKDSKDNRFGFTEDTCENSDGFSLPSDEQTSSQGTFTSSDDQSEDFSNEMATEGETRELREDNVSSHNTINQNESMVFSSSNEMEQVYDLPVPVSQSSSRSTSPTVIEMLAQFRQNFTNLRSISPVIMRSPSPMNSRSSSPRFLRSPSPLEFLEHSLSSLPLDSSTELVFYEDRYILRSYSPVSVGAGDHQVPDVNIDFQQVVSDSEEFPSFRSYIQRRIQNSCEDQVVPEFIEE